MKADMRVLDLLHIRTRIPDRKKGDVVVRKRTDALHEKDSSLLLYENSDDTNKAAFKETLETVAQEKNGKTGKKATVQHVSNKDEKCAGEQDAVQECAKWQNVIASETAEKKVTGKQTTSSNQAIAIIEEALATISEKLHLNIDLSDGLSELTVLTSSDAVLEQFSEILFALQGIRRLLEQAVQHSVALDIKAVMLEPKEVAALEQLLRVELFRLQVAFESLGVAGEVTRMAAEKMQVPVRDAGIPLAKNPSTLSMPDNQLRQLLGSLVDSKEEQITSVIQRMAALAKEPSLEERLAALLQGHTPDEKQAALKVAEVTVGKSAETGKPIDFTAFNSQILRQLLKIDGDSQQFAGEGKSDADAKGDKSPVFTLVSGLSDNKQSFTNQNFQQMLNLSQSVEQAELLAGMDTASRADSNSVEMLPKMPVMPRTIEESVMLQVTQRLNTAVRNGMHEIRLVLRPDSLGDVRMTIQMEGDVVMARINVENQQVKQIIESNLQSLKNALEEQNLQAGAFDVNVNQGSGRDTQEAGSSDRHTQIADNADEVTQDGVDGKTIEAGTETGRRYGSNTVEYFA